jgi:hypothetical protein
MPVKKKAVKKKAAKKPKATARRATRLAVPPAPKPYPETGEM